MMSVRVGEWLAARKKWLVTVATFLSGVALLPQVDGNAKLWVTVALLALNSAGVHQVRNA